MKVRTLNISIDDSSFFEDFFGFSEVEKVWVEIGVFRGGGARSILKYAHPSHLYLIDPWAYEKGMEDWSELYSQKDWDDLYKEIGSNYSQNKNITIHRSTSLSALPHFSDRSIDYMYVDGGHDLPNVLGDIFSWWNKISDDGIMFGDDLQISSVLAAVINFCKFVERDLYIAHWGHEGNQGTRFFVPKKIDFKVPFVTELPLEDVHINTTTTVLSESADSWIANIIRGNPRELAAAKRSQSQLESYELLIESLESKLKAQGDVEANLYRQLLECQNRLVPGG